MSTRILLIDISNRVVIKWSSFGEGGDRIFLYFAMIPEAAHVMLACARIGSVHYIVLGGFSPHALADRIIFYKNQ